MGGVKVDFGKLLVVQVKVKCRVEGKVDFACVEQLAWCAQLMRSGLL